MGLFEEIIRETETKSWPQPATSEEAQEARNRMVHLALKPGDKVTYREGYQTTKFPDVREVVEVFRVLDKFLPPGDSGSSHECSEEDFTVLFRGKEGAFIEYAFDSRRFDRVE